MLYLIHVNYTAYSFINLFISKHQPHIQLIYIHLLKWSTSPSVPYSQDIFKTHCRIASGSTVLLQSHSEPNTCHGMAMVSLDNCFTGRTWSFFSIMVALWTALFHQHNSILNFILLFAYHYLDSVSVLQLELILFINYNTLTV